MVISNTVNLGQLWYKLKLDGGLINLLSTVYAEMYAHVLHTVYILYICSYAHTTATLLLETQTDKIKMNYSYTSADLFCATQKKKKTLCIRLKGEVELTPLQHIWLKTECNLSFLYISWDFSTSTVPTR